MNLLAVAILLGYVASTLAGSAVPRDVKIFEDCKGRQSGVYADGRDCRRYVHCWRDESYFFQCYDGFVFHPCERRCVLRTDCVKPDECNERLGFLFLPGREEAVAQPVIDNAPEQKPNQTTPWPVTSATIKVVNATTFAPEKKEAKVQASTSAASVAPTASSAAAPAATNSTPIPIVAKAAASSALPALPLNTTLLPASTTGLPVESPKPTNPPVTTLGKLPETTPKPSIVKPTIEFALEKEHLMAASSLMKGNNTEFEGSGEEPEEKANFTKIQRMPPMVKAMEPMAPVAPVVPAIIKPIEPPEVVTAKPTKPSLSPAFKNVAVAESNLIPESHIDKPAVSTAAPIVKPAESKPMEAAAVPLAMAKMEANSTMKPVEPATSMKPMELATSPKPVEPKPTEPAPAQKLAEPAPSVAKVLDPAPTVKPVEPMTVAKPVEVAPVAKPVVPAALPKLAESVNVTKPVEPVTTMKPAEPTTIANVTEKPISTAAPVKPIVAEKPAAVERVEKVAVQLPAGVVPEAKKEVIVSTPVAAPKIVDVVVKETLPQMCNISSASEAAVCQCPNKATEAFVNPLDLHAHCERLTCLNGGMYLSLSSGHCGCVCLIGWSGEQCERLVLESQCHCANGGRCVSVGNSTFACECPIGFFGGQCQYDVEAVQPKVGNLVNLPFQRNFERSHQYGRFALCKANLCLNGGLCLQDLQSEQRKCLCTDNYVGQYCERILSP